jgi:hypothetical protein
MNDDRTERENQRLGNLLDDAYLAAVGVREPERTRFLVDLSARLLDESLRGSPWAREAEFAREEDVPTRATSRRGTARSSPLRFT